MELAAKEARLAQLTAWELAAKEKEVAAAWDSSAKQDGRQSPIARRRGAVTKAPIPTFQHPAPRAAAATAEIADVPQESTAPDPRAVPRPRRAASALALAPNVTQLANPTAGPCKANQVSAIVEAVADRKDERETAIKVVARVRPKLPKESMEAIGVETDGSSIQLTDGRATRTFTVDEVIDSQHGDANGTQSAVFNRVGRELMNSSLKGFNVCIFAYGHTGSGKTYTMLGQSSRDTDSWGLLPRFISEIFKTHANDPRKDQTRYTCEFYEVYNEQIRDLLTPVRTDRQRRVHVHPKHGVRIDSLLQSVVNTPEEALALVNFGNQMRTVAATTMNERSSRSHAIFTFKYEIESGGKDAPSQRSAVTFVDLAGREDQEASTNQDQQFREMCYINTSLFHLAHLITKLSEGQVQKGSLADFRNSKLTLLLSQALIGNSRTLLLATVAPLQIFFDDSMSTLYFAQATKKIRTKPMVNIKTGTTIVKELEKELNSLRLELQDAKSGETEKEQELLAAQALIAHYKTTFDEVRQQSATAQNARRRLSSQLGLTDTYDGDSGHPALISGHLVPFFTKLSDDDALQACCNYCLSRGTGEALSTGTLRIGSDEKACDIFLQGVGIRPHMCDVRFKAPDEVVVQLGATEPSEERPRVLVNGCLLTTQQPVKMTSGDSIILGYAHAFRLVVPPLDMDALNVGPIPAADLARSLCPSLDMQSAVKQIYDDSGGDALRKVMPFVQQLSATAPQELVQAFLKSIQMLTPLIDEANLITSEVMTKDVGLVFELLALTNIMDFNDFRVPQLSVSLLQNASKAYQFKSAASAVLDTIRAEKKDSGSDRNGSPAKCRMTSVVDALMPDSPGRVPISKLIQAATIAKQIGKNSAQLAGKAKHPLVDGLDLSDHMKLTSSYDLLYVWSLEKFLRRLKEMRELYQEACEVSDGFVMIRQRLRAKPYLSPWREMTMADVKAIAEDERESHYRKLITSSLMAKQQHPMDTPPMQLRGRATTVQNDLDFQRYATVVAEEKASGVNQRPRTSSPLSLAQVVRSAGTDRDGDLITLAGEDASKQLPFSFSALAGSKQSSPRSSTRSSIVVGAGATLDAMGSTVPAVSSTAPLPMQTGPAIIGDLEPVAEADAPADEQHKVRIGPIGTVLQPSVHQMLAAFEKNRSPVLGSRGNSPPRTVSTIGLASGLMGSSRSISVGQRSGGGSIESSRLPSPRTFSADALNSNLVAPHGTVPASSSSTQPRSDSRGSRRRRCYSPDPETGDAAVRLQATLGDVAGLVRRDIVLLKDELNNCRSDSGNAGEEQQTRLGTLLDRFEGLMSNLTEYARSAPPSAPQSGIQSRDQPQELLSSYKESELGSLGEESPPMAYSALVPAPSLPSYSSSAVAETVARLPVAEVLPVQTVFPFAVQPVLGATVGHLVSTTTHFSSAPSTRTHSPIMVYSSPTRGRRPPSPPSSFAYGSHGSAPVGLAALAATVVPPTPLSPHQASVSVTSTPVRPRSIPNFGAAARGGGTPIVTPRLRRQIH